MNKFTGQVHVQFFGDEREHGWVGSKWVMAYNGVASFEAEAELNVSMKVKPKRYAAWTVAVKAAEQALHLDRPNRIRLLTSMCEPIPHKVSSSPKKRKLSPVKTSSVGADKNSANMSTLSQDDASPPQKKYRRRSSLPVKEEVDKLVVDHVPSVTAECDGSVVATSSESTTGEGTNGKEYSLLLT